jgi:class 3 adenylate cyclase/predicted ATPase
MDIEKWLRGLGLQQYAAAFRDNAVDAEILPELTDVDLEKLGVVLGHRKRLLKAIAALAAPAAVMQATSVGSAPSHGHDAERRQLTVMFCDLVGSTALSAKLDPEDLGEIIGAYHRCVDGTVARFDGYVAKYMGDGVLVYFGYPRAHEDDPERAIRAALAVVEAVGKLQAPERLRVHFGIATGLVVVGELTGSGEAQERGIVGDTPNLAARLQAMAEPDSVVIAASTRRLTEGLFVYEDLGAVEAKGFADPVQAWRVLSESATESRFEALHSTTALTPLVGREEEIELLLRRWAQAKGGAGRVVLLAGEPGIGKSRLIAAIEERIASESHTRLRYFCSLHHQGSALHPTIAQLERAAGLEREDTPEAKLGKLEALVAPTTPAQEDLALLAELLSLQGARSTPPDLSPQRKREKTFEALLRQLELLARQKPVLVIFEDVHWIDPSSRELLDLLIERVRRLPVLLLITFRPEFQSPWTGQPHVTLLALTRLDRQEGMALVQGTAGGKADLLASIVEEIVDRTDGVPLFIEELTKAVLEAGAPEQANRTLAAVSRTALAIPTTLHASLMARLDRLGPRAKEVAHVGAAIGREFAYELLVAVADHSDAELHPALEQLSGAGLVCFRGTPPAATFLFKHALVQDAAYGTLPRGRRRQLHAKIAEVLAQQFPHTVEAEPEVLAHHCTEAGLAAQAVDYWQQAGQRALARSAATEAVTQLERGLNVLQSLPRDYERHRREVALQVLLGQALIGTKGPAAPETGRVYARASELCRELGDMPELFAALYGQHVFHFERAELDRALEVALELLRLAREQGDATATVTGHRLVAAALCHLGRFLEARSHCEEGLALSDPVRDRTSCLFYAFDSRTGCLNRLAHALLALGYPDQARAWARQALIHARELAHSLTLAEALDRTSNLYQILGDRSTARELAEELIALATEQGFPLWSAMAMVVTGSVMADDRRVDDGLAQICEGIAIQRATGSDVFSPYLLALLASAHRRAGQVEAGLARVNDALDRVDRTGGRWFEAELHRVRGELLLVTPAPRLAAEASFRRALTVAREQSARMWELRAATSLARLWRDQNKRTEARDLLAPVYGWFTEGFDTPDLREAKALLIELHK